MKADEIRKLLTDQPNYETELVIFLREIAAQLAELNEKVAKLGDKSVFEQVFGK